MRPRSAAATWPAGSLAGSGVAVALLVGFALSLSSTAVAIKILEDIGELRSDPQLLDLMHASVEGNIATVLHAIHHDIPIERVESPTAALEYARQLAQRGA